MIVENENHLTYSFFYISGVFVFGGVALMVFVDVTRIVIGRLRPDFLETCRVNETMCTQFSSLNDSACFINDKMELRRARYLKMSTLRINMLMICWEKGRKFQLRVMFVTFIGRC